MSAADRLREAAEHLRGRVGKLTTDTDRWDEAFRYAGGVYADTSSYERLIVHPGVGLALADWLDYTANNLPACDCHWPRQPFALADLILDGAA